MTVLRMPSRASFVQYGEFCLLKHMHDEGIEFVIVGSTAAYAYGLNVEPKDIDLAVEYQRARWQRILTLADLVEPHPGGEGQISNDPARLPTQLHFGLGRGVDVISGFQHADFCEIYSRSVEGLIRVEELDDLQLPVRIAGLADLVASWRTRESERDVGLIRAAEELLQI